MEEFSKKECRMSRTEQSSHKVLIQKIIGQYSLFDTV